MQNPKSKASLLLGSDNVIIFPVTCTQNKHFGSEVEQLSYSDQFSFSKENNQLCPVHQ
ncbi:unnamed protein product [Linum tenue]|uniref:Uncharacterized protein n=1 Tax=Linum tenue TaxID=586396 RepID=A0AAV0RFG1_9ROSI|nr:unnamed protein product [Linum tenue]